MVQKYLDHNPDKSLYGLRRSHTEEEDKLNKQEDQLEGQVSYTEPSDDQKKVLADI